MTGRTGAAKGHEGRDHAGSEAAGLSFNGYIEAAVKEKYRQDHGTEMTWGKVEEES